MRPGCDMSECDCPRCRRDQHPCAFCGSTTHATGAYDGKCARPAKPDPLRAARLSAWTRTEAG